MQVASLENLCGKRVLVVDDNRTNGSILKKQLGQAGMDVTVAACGAQALALLEHAAGSGRSFELGVLDLHMPAMNGLMLTREIRSRQAIREIHLIMLTSDRDREEAAEARAGRLASPIRLENLDVQFELRCHLRRGKEAERPGVFTVIRCRSLDKEILRYFLSVCDTIVGIVGDRPKQREVASAVHRLAAIFQKMQKPPTRSINGLFGELYLIWRSESPPAAMTAWRVDETARFDFAAGNVRMDVSCVAGGAGRI